MRERSARAAERCCRKSVGTPLPVQVALTTYAERETWNVSPVFGEKLSPDGNLFFSPLVNAIDIFDGRRGTLLYRVSLPVTLSPNYDALVTDGQDNVLIAITGQNGNGIAVIDLTTLPEPPPTPYVTNVSLLNSLPFSARQNIASRLLQNVKARSELVSVHPRLRHVLHLYKNPASTVSSPNSSVRSQ